MKTGTPPRVDGRSLDYSKMEIQEGDANPEKFSYLVSSAPLSKQRPCHITYTNQEVHDILKTGFEQSPMFTGRIQGLGPRYCPSIEDKINRFADKSRHQIFVEPEGWNTVEVYVNGFSTSLPQEVQLEALKKFPVLRMLKCLDLAMLLNMIIFHLFSLTQHYKQNVFSIFILRAKLMELLATKRRLAKG